LNGITGVLRRPSWGSNVVNSVSARRGSRAIAPVLNPAETGNFFVAPLGFQLLMKLPGVTGRRPCDLRQIQGCRFANSVLLLARRSFTKRQPRFVGRHSIDPHDFRALVKLDTASPDTVIFRAPQTIRLPAGRVPVTVKNHLFRAANGMYALTLPPGAAACAELWDRVPCLIALTPRARTASGQYLIEGFGAGYTTQFVTRNLASALT